MPENERCAEVQRNDRRGHIKDRYIRNQGILSVTAGSDRQEGRKLSADDSVRTETVH